MSLCGTDPRRIKLLPGSINNTVIAHHEHGPKNLKERYKCYQSIFCLISGSFIIIKSVLKS